MRQSKRFKALLRGDRAEVEALGIVVVASSPIDQDAGSYVFGSPDAYTQALEDILTGSIKEVATPHQGDIAVYTDGQDNVIHVGKAVQKERIVVFSTITGSPFVIEHEPILVPTDVPGRIYLTWYRRE